MTVAELLARARSAAGRPTSYRLGAGGLTPDAPHPASSAGGCDCSGYVAWAFGYPREVRPGVWVNTDWIVRDALTEGGMFTRLSTPRVGCVAVYGKKLPTRKYGHVGIVTALSAGKASRVIHCSSGNGRAGDAIAETPAHVFTNSPDTLYAWPVMLDPPPTYAVTPRRTWAVVTTATLNLRPEPNTAHPAVKAAKQGARLVVDAYTTAGQDVSGNPLWLHTVDGLWAWAGGTDLSGDAL